MPIYDYQCPSCQATAECFVHHLDDVIICQHCQSMMRRGFTSPTRIAGDGSAYAARRYPYYDESLDQTFHSPADKRRFLKQTGYQEIPNGVFGIPTRKKSVRYFT